MEDSIDRRVAVVETGIVNIKHNVAKLEVDMRDMRKSMDQKFDLLDAKLDRKFDSLDVKFASLDAKFDAKFASLDAKFDERFASVDGKFDEIHKELRGLLRFMIAVTISFFTTLIGFGAAILGVVAKGFHWL